MKINLEAHEKIDKKFGPFWNQDTRTINAPVFAQHVEADKILNPDSLTIDDEELLQDALNALGNGPDGRAPYKIEPLTTYFEEVYRQVEKGNIQDFTHRPITNTGKQMKALYELIMYPEE